MTDLELEEIRAAAKGRKECGDVGSRKSFPAPSAANASVSGALYWAFVILRHDHPAVLLVGSIALLWQAIRITMSLFSYPVW